MLIKNVTDKLAPKPIGIGSIVIMPGESEEIPDEIAYVEEFDKTGKKTGKTVLLPSIRLMAGLGQLTYEETKKEAVKPVEEKAEEVAPVEEKPAEAPKRGRRKATATS